MLGVFVANIAGDVSNWCGSGGLGEGSVASGCSSLVTPARYLNFFLAN